MAEAPPHLPNTEHVVGSFVEAVQIAQPPPEEAAKSNSPSQIETKTDGRGGICAVLRVCPSGGERPQSSMWAGDRARVKSRRLRGFCALTARSCKSSRTATHYSDPRLDLWRSPKPIWQTAGNCSTAIHAIEGARNDHCSCQCE